MKNKKGFTLAEVLITMAIIGTICMLMIPALQNQQLKRDILLYKKAFNTTTQVVSILTNNSRLYSPNNNNNGINILRDTSAITYNGQNYGGNNKFRELFKCFVNMQPSDPEMTDDEFITSDGIYWRIINTDFTNNNLEISVDINRNGPDCFYDAITCETPDRFIIVVTPQGEVRPPNDSIEVDYLYGKDIFDKSLESDNQDEE